MPEVACFQCKGGQAMTITRKGLLAAAVPVALAALAPTVAAPAAGRPSRRPVPGAKRAFPIIDLHSHWFSPRSLALLPRRDFGPHISVDGLKKKSAAVLADLLHTKVTLLWLENRTDASTGSTGGAC
jgi:hypothetical protein